MFKSSTIEYPPLVTRRSNEEAGQRWRRIMELGFGHYALYRPTHSAGTPFYTNYVSTFHILHILHY